MKFKPWSYQQYATNHIIDHNASALFLDMGMGKTVSTLTAVDNLIFLGEANKILVIAPLMKRKYIIVNLICGLI